MLTIFDCGNKITLSRAWFRSTDFWVMGPARFHCATLLRWTWFLVHECIVLRIIASEIIKIPLQTLILVMSSDSNKMLLAERGFDPRTSGLWAQHASTAPLCSDEPRLRHSNAFLNMKWNNGVKSYLSYTSGAFLYWVIRRQTSNDLPMHKCYLYILQLNRNV